MAHVHMKKVPNYVIELTREEAQGLLDLLESGVIASTLEELKLENLRIALKAFFTNTKLFAGCAKL